MRSFKHTPQDQEISLLKEIKRELSISSSAEVVEQVATVLQTVRQTLTLQNATDMLNRLPDFMKIIFVLNWKQDERPVKIDHLDELVSLVMKRDSKRSKSLFKNEIQTLSVVLLTLKKLFKIVDLDNFEGLSAAFKYELKLAQRQAA